MAGTAVTPVAVDVFLLILATLSIILRVISRKWSKAGLWWDDWLAIAALVCSHLLTCQWHSQQSSSKLTEM